MRSWLRIATGLAGLGAGVWLAGAPAVSQRATREQQVVVSVLDRSNKAVPGLGPADFVVREEGVTREVLRVDQASTPMQIVLLVDTSDDMRIIIQDVRAGIRAFSRMLWERNPETEVGLMEFGERPLLIADRVATANLMDRAVDRLNEHSGSGAYLLEAIVEATKVLKQREATRPLIVAFVRAWSPEFSTLSYQNVEEAVKNVRASLWVLLLQDGARPSLTHEGQQREIVMGDVSARSGGQRDILLDRLAVEKRFKDLAEVLTSQYAVVYSRPESLIPPSKLEVSVKRAGVRTLAPRWTGE